MDCEEASIETGEWDGQGWTVKRLATAVRVHTRTCTADLTFYWHFFGWSGIRTLAGVVPSSMEWRSYHLDLRKRLSVPYRKSKIPSMPKFWLNLRSSSQHKQKIILVKYHYFLRGTQTPHQAHWASMESAVRRCWWGLPCSTDHRSRLHPMADTPN